VNFLPLLLAMLATDDGINRHLYPAKATRFVIVDLAQIRKSGLLDKELEQGFADFIESNEQVKSLSKLLKFDPQRDVNQITICAVGEARQDGNGLMIVNGTFPFDESQKALADMSEQGQLTTMSVNDLPVYFNHRARQAVFFALVDGRTAIATTSKPVLEDAVEGLTNLREPSDDLKARLAKTEATNASVRMAGLFPEDAKRNMKNAPPLAAIAEHLVAFGMTLTLDNGAQVRGRIAMTDEEVSRNAKNSFELLLQLGKVAAAANTERPEGLQVINSVKLDVDGPDVLFTMDLPRDLVERILAQGRDDRARFRERRRQRSQDGENQRPEGEAAPSKEQTN
jgi:hypothetical protein